MPPSIQREAASRIPQQPQAQYSLDEQLEVMIVAARKLGLYDAEDWANTLLRMRRSLSADQRSALRTVAE